MAAMAAPVTVAIDWDTTLRSRPVCAPVTRTRRIETCCGASGYALANKEHDPADPGMARPSVDHQRAVYTALAPNLSSETGLLGQYGLVALGPTETEAF
jgi:hypothetical protein